MSFESPQFRDFSLCVLQKHNCMDQSASIPTLPAVRPFSHWRGQPLTHESAEAIFLGHLRDSNGDLDWSWRVAAGQNAAYDQFPCQYQLWYRGRGGKTLWYDPVFRVKTLDGREVWCRRHYRVRRGEEPGAFWFR